MLAPPSELVVLRTAPQRANSFPQVDSRRVRIGEEIRGSCLWDEEENIILVVSDKADSIWLYLFLTVSPKVEPRLTAELNFLAGCLKKLTFCFAASR